LLDKYIKSSIVCLQFIKVGHSTLHVQMTFEIIRLGFHGAVFKCGQGELRLFTISVVASSRNRVTSNQSALLEPT